MSTMTIRKSNLKEYSNDNQKEVCIYDFMLKTYLNKNYRIGNLRQAVETRELE